MNDNSTIVYIGVGSNIDPRENIQSALSLLMERVIVDATSTFYQTEPLEGRNQADYLNGVWRIETELTPAELKSKVVRDIESCLKRERGSDKYSARTVDLDILLMGSLVHHGDGIVIPDPDIYMRSFIALPLHELDPDLILPDTGTEIAEIVGKFKCDELEPDIEFTNILKRRIAE